jgi:hypothetical protein
MPAVNGVGKPCAGEPHARFDGRELETEQRSDQGHGDERRQGKPCGHKWLRDLPSIFVTAPALDPTWLSRSRLPRGDNRACSAVCTTLSAPARDARWTGCTTHRVALWFSRIGRCTARSGGHSGRGSAMKGSRSRMERSRSRRPARVETSRTRRPALGPRSSRSTRFQARLRSASLSGPTRTDSRTRRR